MHILELYKKYQIMPQLAEHQLLVAAIAEFICGNFSGPNIDAKNIVEACLLHDMGNIVKFDFGYTKQHMPELSVGPKSLAYWQKIQQEFIAKYGGNSHEATANILKQLGIGGRIYDLVDCIGFHQGPANAASHDFGKKICAYSDMRVAPTGVVSLEQRFADLRERYANHPEGTTERDSFEQALRQTEKQIFKHCNIQPQEITE
jgi:hypothetical protein